MKYTLVQLKDKAKKLGFVVKREMDEYTIRKKGAKLDSTYFTPDSVDAWNTMHAMAEPVEAKPVEFKLVIMTEDGKLIDSYESVRASDVQPESQYYRPILTWMMRTLANGGDMVRNGRIKHMPILTKKEGGLTNIYKLRKDMYALTHPMNGQIGDISRKDVANLWGKIEALFDVIGGR